MEVLAAEFPDIFTQYIEIVPEVVTEEIEIQPAAPVPLELENVRVVNVNVTNKAIQDIFLEHDYGQKAFVQEDANQNFSQTDFQNTVFSIEESPKEERSIQTPPKEDIYVAETPYSVESRTCGARYDELDQILEDLRQCDQGLGQDSNSNILFKLEQEKSSLGCNWTSEYSSCDHGPVCPFTSKVLELNKFPESPRSPAVSRNSVVVLRNTPAGYVQQHPVSLGLRSIAPQLGFNMAPVRYNMPTTSSSSSRLNDITNQRVSSYRPPANTVLIKVPGPGLSLCTQCDSQFADNKSLVKHTRNQHQVYQCSKCGESTVGYYRMASHAKKNHSKEPSLFCPCGRTFSEKRGLAKHQNSCVQYKNS